MTLLLAISSIAAANESGHWVCETETLYRKLIAAQLYGVGSPPEQGCIRLPTDLPIEQHRCETTDFELCVYRWTEENKVVEAWGSPIIPSTPSINRN